MTTTRIRPRSPASHRGDPVTSFEAECQANLSGLRDGQATAVFAEMRRGEGRTSAELARAMNLDRHAVARRLPDLEKLGLVRKGESRPCKVTRRNSITWFCIHGGEQGRLF